MRHRLNKLMIVIMVLFFSSCSSTTHLAERSDYLSGVLIQLKKNGDIEIKMPPVKPMSGLSEAPLFPVINSNKVGSFVNQSYQRPLVATPPIPAKSTQTPVNRGPSLKGRPANINIKSVGNVKNQIDNQLSINTKSILIKPIPNVNGANSTILNLDLEAIPDEFKGKINPLLR